MEVIVRAVLAHTGLDRIGITTGFNALQDAVSRGLYTGVPCYVGHGAPRQGHRAQGRFKLGHWNQVEFDEKAGEVIGWMHARFWLPVFSRFAFSEHSFETEKEYRGQTFVNSILHVYSVDLVADSAGQRCRPQRITVLDPGDPPPIIGQRLSRLTTREKFLYSMMSR